MLEDQQFDENQDDFNEKPEQSPPPFNKNQKIAATSLAVFGVLIIVLWFAQLKNNIYGPFNQPVNQSQGVADAVTNDAVLKAKDTDGDGLNDYDELNIYNTSPYLEDTDGDGFKDGEEIENNADPNCPSGRTCTGGLLDNTAPAEGANSSGALPSPENGLNNLVNQSNGLDSLLNQFSVEQSTSGLNALSQEQLNALKNIDVVSLRQLLIQSGMPKETLDKISDADLMQSYSETFNAGQ